MEKLAARLLRRAEKQNVLLVRYRRTVLNLVDKDILHEMDRFVQHSDVSCLEHSLYVSITAFRWAERLGLDADAVARGALLHDFFLYDWHETRPPEGLHGFVHPAIALRNARMHFDITSREADIIEKHMWPLTLPLPRYPESLLVNVVDKVCSTTEILRIRHAKRKQELRSMLGILRSNESS